MPRIDNLLLSKIAQKSFKKKNYRPWSILEDLNVEIKQAPENSEITQIQVSNKDKIKRLGKLDYLGGTQKRMLLILYQSCQMTKSQITEEIHLSLLAKQLNITMGNAKTTLWRLYKKLFITFFDYKAGRGGWSKYKILDNIFLELKQLEKESKNITKFVLDENNLLLSEVIFECNSKKINFYLNKLLTNYKQTINKLLTNYKQTINKSLLKPNFSTKLETENTIKLLTNYEQTINKLLTNYEQMVIETLTNNDFSKNIDIENINKLLTNCEQTINKLLTNYEQTVNKILEKNGFTEYNDVDNIKKLLTNYKQTINKLLISKINLSSNLALEKEIGEKEELTNDILKTSSSSSSSSSSSNNINNINNKYINKHTSEVYTSIINDNIIDNKYYCDKPTLLEKEEKENNLTKSWTNIDISPLSIIGFTTTHLIQIASKNILSAQKVQDSIYAFAFDLQNNGKLKSIDGDPINYFIGILLSGHPYAPPSNYEPPNEKNIKLSIESDQEMKTKQYFSNKSSKLLNNSLNSVKFDQAFKEWTINLTETDIKKFSSLPGITIKEGANINNSKLLESLAKLHFEKEIWSVKEKDFK